jgi:DNA-directed RNA polymerase specialized sigma24 family protein
MSLWETETGPQRQQASVAELIDRMRGGDRSAAAECVTRFGPKIRRRVRGRLRPGMRRLFDSQEILSTVSRRLDQFVSGGKLQAVSEAQLWSLLFTMAERAVIDKSQLFVRLQTVEQSDSALAHMLDAHLRSAERDREDGPEVELDRLLRLLPDAIDREILSLWLHDTPHFMTAQFVGLSAAAVRQRWERIRERLKSAIQEEAAYGQA